MAEEPLSTTPLDALHRQLGARMVPFAGYAMPVQYPTGILTEHLWTRQHAGLFDVSHMGQIRLEGAEAYTALERLVPGDLAALKAGRMRYTLFTDDAAGILDDLMVTRFDDHLFLVVNAGCKAADLAHLQANIEGAGVVLLPDRALLALQGPEAAAVMANVAPEAGALGFLGGGYMKVGGIDCFVTRSGYTGEDGYEISVPNAAATDLAQRLLGDQRVKPIGLGARDSLRLEAGLCLYGHDIDTTTTPIEAGLAWTISKRRRAEGGFPGAAVVQRQLAEGAPRRRVGIRPQDKAPAREGTEVIGPDGGAVGTITSGGFGPSVGGPVAMGYVTAAAAAEGTPLQLMVRGQARPAAVAPLPFTPHRYHRV